MMRCSRRTFCLFVASVSTSAGSSVPLASAFAPARSITSSSSPPPTSPSSVASVVSRQSRLSFSSNNASNTDADADGTMTSADEQQLTSWRSLIEASIGKTRKIRGSNYVQLATVEDDEPRCRTVVFRGFQNLPADHPHYNVCDDDAKSCTFKMCTDARSQKVVQTQQQPVAEILWWFGKTNEQYRVRGTLRLMGSDEKDRTYAVARKELWGNLSDPSREGFLGKAVPGDEYVDPSTLPTPPEGGRDEDGKVVPPSDTFLLMLLDPIEVDYLLLGKDQHRQIDTRGPDGKWTSRRVNP